MIGDKAGWICLWCQEKFKGQNATKALAHVSKTVNLGQHVKSCKAAIPDNYKKRYETMANAFKAKRSAKKRVAENVDYAVEVAQAQTTIMHMAKKPRKYGQFTSSSAKSSGSIDAYLTPRNPSSGGGSGTGSAADP